MELGDAGTVRLHFPPDPVTAHQVRGIRPRGTWLPAERCWEFPFEAVQQLHRHFGSRFTITPALQRWLETTVYPLPPFPGHRELVAAAGMDQPLADGRCLLRHQRHAVRWLLARRGAVLADEMGLGKTLSALVAARALARVAQLHIVVLAPVSVHGHWRREALAVEVDVHLLSWASIPPEPPSAGYVLIADEAHYAQNVNTRRCRGLLRLARHPRLRCCWLLSGTPMKNGRPHQLLPLLAAIGHPIARNRRWYERTFCNGHWGERHGRRHWHCDGVSHLPELRRLTRPLILYRRKQQCLELPPKSRQLLTIRLNTTEAAAFQAALDRAVATYRCRVVQGEVSHHAESLALLTAMRRLGAAVKTPRIAELLQQLLRQGHAVVMFSNFCQPLRHLQARLGTGAILSGASSPAQREQMVWAFQQGSVNLLLATYGAAGLGYNLQRASHVVLLERPWTPGDAEQAEDRCHRIGSRHALVSLWPQLGIADHLVDELIASKARHVDAVFGNSPARQMRAALVERMHSLLETS